MKIDAILGLIISIWLVLLTWFIMDMTNDQPTQTRVIHYDELVNADTYVFDDMYLDSIR